MSTTRTGLTALASLTITATSATAGPCEQVWLTDLGIPASIELYGISGSVRATTLWDPDGPGPLSTQLVAVGSFSVNNSADHGSVARWDGTRWHSFPNRLAFFGTGFVPSLYSVTTTGDGTLFIGGSFYRNWNTGEWIPGVARWDGTAWRALTNSVGSEGRADYLVPLSDGTVAGIGRFPLANGTFFYGIGRWTGAEWVSLYNWTSAFISINTLLPSGINLIAAGSISHGSLPGIEDVMQRPYAATSSWTGFATAPGQIGAASRVNAITRLPGGELVVGGRLSQTGDRLVARWDGAQWTAMDSGLSGITEIGALYTHTDGTLYAGSRTSPSSGIEGRLYRWTGATWETMATLQAGKSVSMIGPMPDGNVVACGDFGNITQNGVTLWTNGIVRLGPPVPVIVPEPWRRLTCPRGPALYGIAPQTPASDAFQWQIQDDQAPGGWRNLQDGPDGALTIEGATTSQMQVWPDAMFTTENLPTVRVIVTNACGSTTSAPLTAIFCPADWDCSGGIDGDDISAFFTDWLQGNGDADQSGATDGDDIAAFFAAWQLGRC